MHCFEYPVFLSSKQKLKRASTVIAGIPYDGTSSYCPGSRFGPDALRQASNSIETYDPVFNFDISNLPIGDAGNLYVSFGDVKQAMKEIEEGIKTLVEEYVNCKFLFIGGEHLISLPVVSCLKKAYAELAVIQFDAHTDLRNSYWGQKLNHATVMRRIVELIGGKNVYQVGIRSGTKEEFIYGKKTTHFYPLLPPHPNPMHKMHNIFSEITKKIGNTPVYITLDLDILDPSCLPGTGNQEPGGVTFNELEKFLIEIQGLNIIGADIVELCPLRDINDISAVAAAKLARQLLILLNNK